jgi:hypothetical protein
MRPLIFSRDRTHYIFWCEVVSIVDLKGKVKAILGKKPSNKDALGEAEPQMAMVLSKQPVEPDTVPTDAPLTE